MVSFYSWCILMFNLKSSIQKNIVPLHTDCQTVTLNPTWTLSATSFERCFQLERVRSNRVFYSHAIQWVASDCSSTMNVLHIVLTVMAANFQLVSKWVSPLLYVFLDWKLEHWGIIFIRSMPCSQETGRNQESICENYSKSCVVPAGLKCGEISIMNFDTREPCATPLWNFGNLIDLRGRRMNKTDAQAWVGCCV